MLSLHAARSASFVPHARARRPQMALDGKLRLPLETYTKLVAATAIATLLIYTLIDYIPRKCATATPITSSDRSADAAAARRHEWDALSTLVLVAGHAIFVSPSWDARSLTDERNWVLEHFQKGQVGTFLAHVEKGVRLAANDSSALLLFSGGQTRAGAGPRSEGVTYWLAADAHSWFGNPDLRNRSYVEEYARDSLENLLFSVCRFRQVVGSYPRVVKVVGFGFKRARFVDMHRRAIRFPAHRFEYYGIDPDDVGGMRGVAAGERAQAMGPFAGDPYGCRTRVLGEKRMERNPYMRFHPYPQGCPELAGLFRHCGRSTFTGPLPWDPRVNVQRDQ